MNNYLHNDSSSGQWECPDIFKLPVTSSTNNNDNIWIIKASLGARDHYAIGTIGSSSSSSSSSPDGVQFIPHVNSNGVESSITDNSKLFDFGGHYYASKSFYDFKNSSYIRQIIFGWLTEERGVDSNGGPYGWAGVQSLPRDIRLFYNETNDDYIMYTPVVKEFDALRINSTYFEMKNISVNNNEMYWFDELLVSGNQMDITMNGLSSTDMANGECILYVLSDGNPMKEYTTIGVKFGSGTYYVDNTKSTLNPNVTTAVSTASVQGWKIGAELTSMRIIIDHSVIEVYVNNGISCMTRRVYQTLVESVKVGLFSTGGTGNCLVDSFVSYNVMTTMY